MSAQQFRSNAQWPQGAVSLFNADNVSTDMHDTKEQAEAVCSMLRRHGFGGNGEIFPLRVWVDSPTATPPTERATEGEPWKAAASELKSLSDQVAHERNPIVRPLRDDEQVPNSAPAPTVASAPWLDRFADQSGQPGMVTISAEGAAPAVAQGETPPVGHETCWKTFATLRQQLAQVEKERDEARADSKKYWVQLCDTVGAMGKVSPEAAPYSVDWAKDLLARLTASEAELAELRLDRERLEWLENACTRLLDLDTDPDQPQRYRLEYWQGVNGHKAIEAETITQAIDAARNQQENRE